MRFIALQLRRLFLDHDCVVVPGLGGFVFHAVPARYDADARVLVPPGREVVFNPRLIHNDGVLAHALAVGMGWPYAEALGVIEQEAAAMRSALSTGAAVVLPEVGRLYREAGSVRFVADAGLERDLRSFGLQRLPLVPLVLPSAVPADVLDAAEAPVVPFRRALLRVAAVLAVPVSVGAASWLGAGVPGDRFGFGGPPSLESSSYVPRFAVEAFALPAPATEPVYEAAWANDPAEIRFHFRTEHLSERGVRIVGHAAAVPAVPAPVAAVPTPAVDAPFEVVVGAFAQAGNAARLAERLAAAGQTARTDLRGDGMTLVVWGGYGDAAQAERARSEAAAAGFQGAWVRRMP